MNNDHYKVSVIGGGPAGLTAAYLLSKQGVSLKVFEADPRYVGGISKTVEYKGFLFDIGGHRFFSKSKEVEDLWTEILPDDFLDRPRSSKIYYDRKFYTYPLKAFEALLNLGIFEAVACVLSYLKVKIFPIDNPKNFEEWVVNNFGRRLFSIFFKTYTEKVWGMDCKEISADWAAQRIKGLSLLSAVVNALNIIPKPKDRSKVIKTIIDSFRYPRRGPGQMWEMAAKKTQANGGRVLMGARVESLSFDVVTRKWSTTFTQNGTTQITTSDYVISSAPLAQTIKNLSPCVPENVAKAAAALKYRDFLVIALIAKDRKIFSDNWIYIHDPDVLVGRIQNFKSWSPEMVPDPSLNCYGMEYFCFENDNLWNTPDDILLELAKSEIVKLGLAVPEDIIDGTVIRQAKAYPVYDADYVKNVEIVRDHIEENYPGFCFVGRNGMHKYNNQDHSMMTAMLTAQNIIEGKKKFNVWAVNQDAEYHEADVVSTTSGLRMVPSKA